MKKRNFLYGVDFSKPPKIDFLKRLTTPTGIMQHAKFGVPERSWGYALDDNARALIFVVEAFKLYRKKEYLDLAVVYLSYLTHSKRQDRFFNNFQSFDHKFKTVISEDAFGECIWALGVTMAAKPRSDLTLAAGSLYNEVKENIFKLTSPRAKAYIIIGLCAILNSSQGGDFEVETLKKLTKDLLVLYKKNQSSGWNWFEKYLVYANHILPASLFFAYKHLKDKAILEVASSSLKFLEEQTNKEGTPCPIGSFGWFKKGEEKAIYDQQAMDPTYAVLANLASFSVVRGRKYLTAAKKWFSWFHGFNIKGIKVYDKNTSGCYDGINEAGVNLNQGAESTICYLLAYVNLARHIKIGFNKTKLSEKLLAL
ncbi:MAG: hypothetical protein A2172_02595 [Candidatus Woykebacteria bacterium RBG_13_40_15]|uniref:Glycosyltransferase n=1 Tax=Candidatus Woykebacteria bacterium RBG_13_40_15 TaxID=1802593 RepID=A0A1G1W6F0_9BACT|nr:MAG: hypothetical protein A2172_02595 [Candidatus Woykebacteria bacterium RBG_13_40_15]